MPDYLILFGLILAGTIILTWAHNLFEIVYWKYIDWKYGEEKDQ